MNDQEKAVAAFLESKGITFSVTGGFETKREDWVCDQWQTRFSRPGKETLVEDYYTGTGHRKSKVKMPADIARLGPNILARVNWEKAYLKPVAPNAAGVLYSLIRDAQGAEQNFADWCSDYGYDSDSIKALNTYNACCAILTKVRAFFTREERAELDKLLEDY